MKITAVEVWPGWLRLTHLLLALGIGFQLFSAWALDQGVMNQAFWIEWHLMVGQALIFVFAARLAMLVQKGSGNWRSLLFDANSRKGALEMLKSYVTFGANPLPNWFAHSPLWKPVYVLIFVLIAIALSTGMWINSDLLLLGHSLRDIHESSTTLLGILLLAHMVTALFHDWKGDGASISAMLSGKRYFHQEERKQQLGVHSQVKVDFKRPGPN